MSSFIVAVAPLAQAAGAAVGGKVTPAQPSPPPKPVQTTLEGVLAGKYRAAGLISFQAVVLRATAIQVRSGGRTSY